MLIKRVNKHVFDVFIGQGWEEWSRFEAKKGTLFLVKGKPLNRKDYGDACAAIRHETSVR